MEGNVPWFSQEHLCHLHWWARPAIHLRSEVRCAHEEARSVPAAGQGWPVPVQGGTALPGTLSPASVRLPASPGASAQPVSSSRHRLGPQPSQCPAPGIERSAHPVCFLGLCTQGRWVGGGDGGLEGLGSGLPCHSAISSQSVVCPLTFYFNAPD